MILPTRPLKALYLAIFSEIQVWGEISETDFLPSIEGTACSRLEANDFPRHTDLPVPCAAMGERHDAIPPDTCEVLRSLLGVGARAA
eukprot:2863356-Prymnesium_polylepis.1